jgi:hypothetical protein
VVSSLARRRGDGLTSLLVAHQLHIGILEGGHGSFHADDAVVQPPDGLVTVGLLAQERVDET